MVWIKIRDAIWLDLVLTQDVGNDARQVYWHRHNIFNLRPHYVEPNTPSVLHDLLVLISEHLEDVLVFEDLIGFIAAH